ncbi:unnamed protein product (macronuclear) [Paramecium tetraurelia]|uniref:Uncharacterized protein n=1 Tax=Paramecium tetraurelia TaxID=5888 RepID=A0EH36_PARTE|nr:uncharacterized protein GSPATT00026951001 [Paramecium tetraurelia]CAK94627.1 unnamed protein product [Paramecium tetraurelia]|eukprot:XP_001462000.1 hypothetical protein (macronuclear) [Paramecium tetraurelia strain d4-2]
MLNKPELSKELSVFLELLHQDNGEYKGYENYLIGSDLDEMDIHSKRGFNKDLSIIYSQPESEVSTQRDNASLNIGDLFSVIFRDLENQAYSTLSQRIKQLQVRWLFKLISEKLSEFQQQNQSLETNNKLLVQALNSSQQEIQVLAVSHEESSNKLKKSIQDLKKQCEELHKSLAYTQQINQNLLSQIDREQSTYKKNEEEFRDASQRLIKSNQALRYCIPIEISEIIVNIGNISPMHKSKLQEVIKYLNDGIDTKQQELRSGRSQSRKQKENNSLHYSTLNISSNRNKKSMSPQGFTSTRKQQGVNVLDTNYQTSYKELFLKSLKVTKQK